MNLTFCIFGERERQEYETWFADPELARRVSFPDSQWFDYVCHTPGVYAWMIFDDATPIGHVQLDVEDEERASIALVVKAECRRQGYGAQILRELVNRPEVSTVTTFEGYAEVDNLASQRCVTSAGFTLVDATPDEDGMLKYSYRL